MDVIREPVQLISPKPFRLAVLSKYRECYYQERTGRQLARAHPRNQTSLNSNITLEIYLVKNSGRETSRLDATVAACSIYQIRLFLFAGHGIIMSALQRRFFHGRYPASTTPALMERTPGPRDCIGYNTNLIELRVMLVMGVRTMRSRPAYEEWDETRKKGLVES